MNRNRYQDLNTFTCSTGKSVGRKVQTVNGLKIAVWFVILAATLAVVVRYL